MAIIVVVILLVVALLLFLVIISAFFFAIDAFLDLPYVATKRGKIATIIKFANIKAGQTVIDLGSGDGRLLLAAARKGAHAIGYEINPFLILITKIRARMLSSSLIPSFPRPPKAGPPLAEKRESGFSIKACTRPDRVSRMTGDSSRFARTIGTVTVYKSNLWKADLAIADVVFVYGRKKSMQKFQDFVYQNAKSGTRVVVNTNAFPNKKYLKSQNEVFLYRL